MTKRHGGMVIVQLPFLIIEPQLSEVSPLRKRMEDPILVIVHVIDTADGGDLLCDPVSRDQVGDKIACQPGIGETIGIRIVQLAELATAVTNIH